MRAAGRRRTRTLHAGVHVGLVVVADVEDVVVALEHPGQAGHADVDGAAVAALGQHADVTGRSSAAAAATPVATEAALANSECSHGNCHELSGYGVEKTSRHPVALTATSRPLVARYAVSST